MEEIILDSTPRSGIKIMVFTEGTILKHRAWWRVQDFASYVPVGNCAALLQSWWEQGADVVYCTSRRGRQAKVIANLLRRYGLPGSRLLARGKSEPYAEIVERVKPAVLIEDDCASIGGTSQMCITNVKSEIKNTIKSISVKEFEGIDHLPTDLRDLAEND